MTADNEEHMDQCIGCDRWAPFVQKPNGEWECQFCYARVPSLGTAQHLSVTAGDAAEEVDPEDIIPEQEVAARLSQAFSGIDSPQVPAPPQSPPADPDALQQFPEGQVPEGQDAIRVWRDEAAKIRHRYRLLNRRRNQLVREVQSEIIEAKKHGQLDEFKGALEKLLTDLRQMFE